MPKSTRTKRSVPRYELLANDIHQMIESDTVAAGTRLPSVREMSRKRGLSVTTVLEAYRRLENAGLIEARPQSGYYVQRKASPCTPPDISRPSQTPTEVGRSALIQELLQEAGEGIRYPFGAAVVDGDFLPQKTLSGILARIVRNDFSSQDYLFPPGHEGLRRQIARRLSEAGAHAMTEDIIIANGCTEACNLCLQAILEPGDTVAIESPAYYGCLEWIELHGLRAHQMPTDPATGIDVDAVERAMRQGSIQAVLVTPNFQNPTGARMPDAAKEKLARLARSYRIPVVEDDVYGELAFNGSRPTLVRNFARDGWVLTCGSYSKSLAPGLRVGWVAPGRFYPEVLQRKRISSMASPTLAQMALAEYLEAGGYDRHLRRLRRELHGNMDRFTRHLVEALPGGARITHPEGGFILWVEMPEGFDALELKRAALERGISIAPGHLFAPDDRYAHCFRLNTAIPWNEATAGAIHTLGTLAREI